jgi:membrane glycosyltransferase
MSLLCLGLIAWIAFGFLSGLAGLIVLLRERRKAAPTQGRTLPRRMVAVLIPVYNEDIGAVAGRIRQMTDSLARIGGQHLFDFFVLSDSNAAAEASERAACRRLRRPGGCAIHYRRRLVNTERKPGNIAEWVRRFGGGYESMIVLDADSLMSGGVMARLACAMEADPGLGLIQTNPMLIGSRTLFARWQQFATTLYGPIASAGLNWWSGEEATFWGHNAILRVRAFAESCGLPRLSGPEPFGGPVLSHDMIEAALIRRRGWRARMMLLPAGSYEESPPTLVDHGVRDRRWCQGNLQHLRLLETAGLHWVSRLQLFMGASAYLTSPLWLLLLLTGLFQSVRTGTPMADLGAPAWLIVLTVVLLFGTKLMALVWVAFDRDLVRQLGGWRCILLGVTAEVPLSVIAAPVMMLSQCFAIGEIVAGRPSGWLPQRRDTDGIALAEALDHYRWHMLLGLVFWTVSLSEVDGALWGMPVALGLLGAPLLATWTSRADWGAKAASHGLFISEPVLELAPGRTEQDQRATSVEGLLAA